MTRNGEELARMLWVGLAIVLVLAICVRRWLPAPVKGAIAGVYSLVCLAVLWSLLAGLAIPFNPVPARGWDAVIAVPAVLLIYSLASGGLLLIVPAAMGAVAAIALSRWRRNRELRRGDS